MSKPIEYQTIEHCGHPAYVLVPWEEWNRIKPLLEAERARAGGIPQDVVVPFRVTLACVTRCAELL